MDTIILLNKDVENLIKWRDNNKNLVRQNVTPFKSITLDFPETKINIKSYNDNGKISFYIRINGVNIGKILGQQMAGGFFKLKKNTTKLKSEDLQSIITVYSSLMAFICHYKPIKKDTPKTDKQRSKHTTQGKKKRGTTYIFNGSETNLTLKPQGTHASPKGSFNVRGHYRKYKNGTTVWIEPYIKGKGKPQDKVYKIKKTVD